MPAANGSADDYIVPIWIDGKELPTDKSKAFPVVNSTSGRAVHHAQAADIQTALAAVDSSKAAFRTWKRAPVATRRNLLLKLADVFERRADEFVQSQIDETACDEVWGRTNIAITVGYIRETAACVSGLTGIIPPIDKPDTMGFVFKEPVGPVLTIPPWNGALVLATRALCSAIGAGCTVVLKASELSPKTHHMIVQAFTEAGVPPGVLNQIQVARKDAAEITEAIIAHEAIRKVEFIGSAAVGRIIGSVAAKHLKPILMELGGKGPAIVLDDANLEKAAVLCAKGATLHHGQICFSTERVIVLRSVADRFQELFVKAFENSPSGSAAVSEGIAKHAQEVLQDAKDKGHKFLTGDTDFSKPMTLKPTIVLEPKDSRIVDEETFGPSASLYVVDDDQAAIDLANRTAYGLNATIHSLNMERAIKMARELEYGQVHVNSISVYTAATASQGGVKGSGWGRQNGKWGLEEFVVDKFVSYHGKDS